MGADATVKAEADPIVTEAKKRFTRCVEWEGESRSRFIDDLKFAHGDSDNGFQWPNALMMSRAVNSRPCLTMNVIRQHNLQIVNDLKKNKSGMNVRPAGGGATKEASDVVRALIRHIEYQSMAQAAYSTAAEFQVAGGIGWWRLVTDYADNDTFEQEIFIRRVQDPLTVYMDPDCQMKDCSDAKFAFVFDTVPKDEFDRAYPEFKDVTSLQPMNVGASDGDWVTKDHVRVAEYFRKVPKKDKLVSFVAPDTGERVSIRASKLPEDVLESVLEHPLTKWREIVEDEIEWKLIVGGKICDDTVWVGKYIPLIRVIGEETTIEGELDRKGHTRSMKDAQRMYNYNSPLALSTPLATPLGWTTMGDVKRGDQLLNEKGQPVTVLGTSPVLKDRDCFKITFTDGSSIVADSEHLWTVEERGKRVAAGFPWKEKTIKTSELVKGKHFICLTEPLELAEDENLPIHPYLLGAWLGDGDTATPRITSHVDDIEELRAHIATLGYDVGEARIDHAVNCGVFTVLGVRHKFTQAGFLGDKYIPTQYLRASYQQRLALLQGLMDTDGHVTPSKQCVFINTNSELVTGFIELLRSLGIKPGVARSHGSRRKFPNGKWYDTQDSYRVSFTADPNMEVFKLSRKRTVQEEIRPLHWRRTKRFGIEEIVSVPSVPVKCVSVDSPTHLFLAGWGMVPTHNSAQVEFVALQGKSPWIAPSKAIEGYETMWNSANLVNHSVLIWNHVDEDGSTPIPPPFKPAPPTAAPAFEAGMGTAFNQMMMTSGQWQNQMGMMGNERTGAAIEKRQDQGETATFHFTDNFLDSIRYTGVQILDLIPKIYDTKRMVSVIGEDGTEFELQIDPAARQTYMQRLDHQGNVIERVLNPNLGKFTVEADAGPALGTRRQETVNALTTIITQAPGLTGIIGDLLMSSMDFEKAQEAALRLRRMVPKVALGEGPTQNEQQQQQMIEALQGALAKSLEKHGKDQLKLVGKDQKRDIDAYKAETDRMKALAKDLGIDPEGLQAVIQQLVGEALQTHLAPILEANQDGVVEQSGADNLELLNQPTNPNDLAPGHEWALVNPQRSTRLMRIGPLAQQRTLGR